MNIADLKKLKNKDGFHEIDLQFAGFILREAKTDDYYLYLAAAVASHALRSGSMCAELNYISKNKFPVYKSGIEIDKPQTHLPQVILPNLEKWTGLLSKYPEIISEKNYTPLILDNSNRLYMHRYWNYENCFAENIQKRCFSDDKYTKLLASNQICNISKYFKVNTKEIDWQQVAIYTALANNFSVITGGPGTGKTTAVSALLAILLDLEPDSKIRICAPTGKAAGRLIESISEELIHLKPIDPATIGKLKKLEAHTIHRLLGTLPLSPHFKHNSINPILADIVIIDEASMIPQTLFAKLFDAIPKSAKIVLLGDKDQLASVEAGAVFANICEVGKPNKFTPKFIKQLKGTFIFGRFEQIDDYEGLSNCIVELKTSHRFSDTRGIGRLKTAINNDEVNILETALSKSDELALKHLPKRDKLAAHLIQYLSSVKIDLFSDAIISSYNFTDYKKSMDIETAYRIFSDFKILCSHNVGPFGVDNINRIVHDFLFDDPFYKLPIGTPIMILENNHQLNLFNGDVGIIWNDDNGNKKAFFPEISQEIHGHGVSKVNNQSSRLKNCDKTKDALKKNTLRYKPYSIALLPAYKEVFAMTIHKSQGSGFQNILVILPDMFSPILTKELIYTAITRAKQYCEIWSPYDIFTKSVKHKTQRDSGLKEKL